MKRLLTSLLVLLVPGSWLCQAAEPTSESFRVAVVAGIPQSSFKDLTSSSGFGFSAGWNFWSMSPNTNAGIYFENIWYSIDSQQAVLTNVGLDMKSRIKGGFYDRFGIGAIRVKLPNEEATTKLVGIFGIGYRFNKAFGLEIYSSSLPSSNPPASTLNMAIVWNF